MAAPQIAAPVTDDELISQVKMGDRDAFDLLYERYISRVYHFVDKRLRNRAGPAVLGREEAYLFGRADSFDDRVERVIRQVRQIRFIPALFDASKCELHRADMRHDLASFGADPIT